MALNCSGCERQYREADVRLGLVLVCTCGRPVFPTPRRKLAAAARKKQLQLQQLADDVCRLILKEDFPEVDLQIAKAQFREVAMRMFPGRETLYEMIYAARFRRLEQQFRS